MITEADYQRWLLNPRSERVVLYEFADQRFANLPWRGWIEGRPYPFRPLVASPLRLVSSLKSGVALGELELLNDGELDQLLTNSWYGEPFTVRWGAPSWDYADCRVQVRGQIEHIIPSGRGRLKLRFRDQNALLDQSYLTERHNNGLLPEVLGTVFSVPGLALNDNRTQFALSQSGFNEVTCRVAGHEVTVSADQQSGQVVLGAEPQGDVSFDVQQADSTLLHIVSQLALKVGINQVITRHLSSQQATLTAGLWIDNDATVGRLLTDLLEPLSIYPRITADQQLELVYIGHAGDPDLVLMPRHVLWGSMRHTAVTEPAATVNLHYRRNWRPLSNLDGVPAVAADVLSRDYQLLSDTTGYSADIYASTDYYTALADLASAEDEMGRRMFRDQVFRRSLSCTVFAPGMNIFVGDRVGFYQGASLLKYAPAGAVRNILHGGRQSEEVTVGTVINVEKQYGNRNQAKVGFVI